MQGLHGGFTINRTRHTFTPLSTLTHQLQSAERVLKLLVYIELSCDPPVLRNGDELHNSLVMRKTSNTFPDTTDIKLKYAIEYILSLIHI